MRLGRAAFALTVGSIAATACLFPSLDDLEGGGLAPDGTTIGDAPIGSDGGMEAASDGSTSDTYVPLADLDCDAAVAVWPLNEGSGSKVFDCKHLFPGTIDDAGYTWTRTPTDAGAIAFSGSRVSFGDKAALKLVGGDTRTPTNFTVMARIAIPDVSAATVHFFVGRSVGFHDAWAFAVEIGADVKADLLLRLPIPPDAAPGSTLDMKGTTFNADTAWHHVAVAYRGATTFDFYLDGNANGSAQYDAGAWLPLDSELEIGGISGNGSYVLRGSMRDVRLYATDLTKAQIQAIAAEP